MASSRFLALLRGINVGGNHIVKMANLKTVFEQMGFTHVYTYIQSGNVIFTSTNSSVAAITTSIDNKLKKEFSFPIPVFIISDSQLQAVVSQAPRGFGVHPELYRYDVIFLAPPLIAKDIFAQIPKKEDVDSVYLGENVLYFSRLIAKATQSKLSRLVTMPIYKHMTIRNWNTTTTLLRLMSAST